LERVFVRAEVSLGWGGCKDEKKWDRKRKKSHVQDGSASIGANHEVGGGKSQKKKNLTKGASGPESKNKVSGKISGGAGTARTQKPGKVRQKGERAEIVRGRKRTGLPTSKKGGVQGQARQRGWLSGMNVQGF